MRKYLIKIKYGILFMIAHCAACASPAPTPCEIVADAYCARAEECEGFPNGGADTCVADFIRQCKVEAPKEDQPKAEECAATWESGTCDHYFNVKYRWDVPACDLSTWGTY